MSDPANSKDNGISVTAHPTGSVTASSSSATATGNPTTGDFSAATTDKGQTNVNTSISGDGNKTGVGVTTPTGRGVGGFVDTGTGTSGADGQAANVFIYGASLTKFFNYVSGGSVNTGFKDKTGSINHQASFNKTDAATDAALGLSGDVGGFSAQGGIISHQDQKGTTVQGYAGAGRDFGLAGVDAAVESAKNKYSPDRTTGYFGANVTGNLDGAQATGRLGVFDTHYEGVPQNEIGLGCGTTSPTTGMPTNRYSAVDPFAEPKAPDIGAIENANAMAFKTSGTVPANPADVARTADAKVAQAIAAYKDQVSNFDTNNFGYNNVTFPKIAAQVAPAMAQQQNLENMSNATSLQG